VLPNGNIDGYFIYYVDRKEKQKKIGRYGKGSMSLKAIRDKCSELSKKYQSGIDVKQQEIEQAATQDRERQEQAVIERKKQMQGSFQQLVDLYLVHVKSELSHHHYEAIKKAYNFNLQGFDCTIKASDISKQDIISIINPITARGSLIAANRMRAYLSAMFKWGIEFDDEPDAIKINVQFYIESNPVTYVFTYVKKPLKKEAPTDRFLTESEVRTFWAALDKSSMSPHRANVFRLMLALGARVEALSGLRWADIDWKERLITIPPERSKNGAYWVIPINDIAYEVLINNPKFNAEFLFPAKNGKEPLRLDGYAKAITRTCKQFSIESFTPKDLRTTFKTLAGKAGGMCQ
jgi:integrase